MTQSVLAIAEQTADAFRKVTYETISAGRRLASEVGGSLIALALGSGVQGMAAQLGDYGAERIHVADDAALAEYTAEAYCQVCAAVIADLAPAVVLMGATSRGKDLAARLSARLNAALATDCVALKWQDGAVRATRPMYGGKILAEVTLAGQPQMATIRPHTFETRRAPVQAGVEKIDLDVPADRVKFIEKRMESGKMDITEADIVVSGGRGMGGDDYSVIEVLAEQLGAAVGASRSAVDEGWRPFSDQVGQTGKVVSPNLYVACGISGAIQHLAGMSSSKVIVAINKDPDAPIFARSDYGIVGDLFEVVPHITEAVRKLKTG